MIRNWRTSLLTTLVCVVAVLSMTALSAAQESSDDAIEQYGAAVSFQNQAVADPDTADVNYGLAVEEYKTFLKKFGDDPLASKAQHYLGVCQWQLGKYKDAVASFETVVSKYPDFEMLAETYYNLGVARMELGRKSNDKDTLSKAKDAFAKVVAEFGKSSNAPESQFQVGELLYELGNKKDAIAAYQAAMELFGAKAKRRPTVLYNLGFVQEETGDIVGAEKTYDLFLTEYGQKKPPHPLLNEVYLRKGDVLVKRKKYKDAGPWLAAAARAEGFKNADLATVQQAFCKFNLKEYADAAKLYADVVEKWPQSQYANSSRIDAGKAYFWAADYDASAKWLEKAINAGGKGAIEATSLLGRTLLKQGKPAETLTAIEAILPKAAGSQYLPAILLARADALYEIPKRRDESIAAYAKVAEDHPGDDVAPRALYLAAFVAQERGQHKEGLKYAESFLESFAEKASGEQYVDDVKNIAAGCHLLLKQYGPAQTLYSELLAEYPNDKNVERWNVQIGLCKFLAQKYDDAVKHLSPIAAEIKDAHLKAEAHHLLGASQFELGKYQAARDALAAAVTADARWRDADRTLLLLSLAEQRLGDAQAALATAQRVLAEFPKSQVIDEAHFRVGEYAYERNDYAKAQTEYQAVLDNYPKSQFVPYALDGLGWTAIKQDKFADAEKTFTTLLENYKDHKVAPKATMARAVTREKLEKYGPAIADVTAFLATNPQGRDRVDALLIKGRCEARDGKAADAVKSFEAVLADAPDDFAKDEVLYELAWAHRDAKQEEKAVAAFERLAEQYAKSPYAAESFHHVGQHHYGKKDYKKAAVAYYAAMNAAKDKKLKERAAHKLAWSYYMQDDFKNAEQTFAFQLKTLPGGDLAADAKYMLAESQFKQGGEKTAEALESYQSALKLKPSTPTLKTLALLHAGQAAGVLKMWDESLEFLTALTTDHADSELVPDALFEQGQAKRNKGDLDGAMELYEEVLERASRTLVGARARFMTGEVLFAQKHHTKAMAQFGRVFLGYQNAPPEFDTWKANSLFEYARCLEVLKRADAAKKYYKQLVTDYPKSDKVTLAQQRIAALGG